MREPLQKSLTVAALNNFLQLITSALVSVGLHWAFDYRCPGSFGCRLRVWHCLYIVRNDCRRELQSNGKKIADATGYQLKALQEGLGAIREVLDSSNHLSQIYQQADRVQRKLQAKNTFIGAFPRYALGFRPVGDCFALGLLVFQRGSGAAVIPLLGALALGAQRLLPALQQVYSSWAALKSFNPAIQDVLSMLAQPLPPQVSAVKPLPLRQCISLHDVHFRYGTDKPEVLRGLNLEIHCGECVGLIGSTGSGKSTTVDLLMGLLAPTRGRVLIDGADLHDFDNDHRLVAWRAAIAHVPQNIFGRQPIAENIAFGVPRDQIDLDRVKQATAGSN